jgi:hypothetical protein
MKICCWLLREEGDDVRRCLSEKVMKICDKLKDLVQNAVYENISKSDITHPKVEGLKK